MDWAYGTHAPGRMRQSELSELRRLPATATTLATLASSAATSALALTATSATSAITAAAHTTPELQSTPPPFPPFSALLRGAPLLHGGLHLHLQRHPPAPPSPDTHLHLHLHLHKNLMVHNDVQLQSPTAKIAPASTQTSRQPVVPQQAYNARQSLDTILYAASALGLLVALVIRQRWHKQGAGPMEAQPSGERSAATRMRQPRSSTGSRHARRASSAPSSRGVISVNNVNQAGTGQQSSRTMSRALHAQGSCYMPVPGQAV